MALSSLCRTNAMARAHSRRARAHTALPDNRAQNARGQTHADETSMQLLHAQTAAAISFQSPSDRPPTDLRPTSDLLGISIRSLMPTFCRQHMTIWLSLHSSSCTDDPFPSPPHIRVHTTRWLVTLHQCCRFRPPPRQSEPHPPHRWPQLRPRRRSTRASSSQACT